jgi:uncharacterized protein
MPSAVDALLVFVALPGGAFPTDRIRVMKGMFLLSQEGPADLRDLYTFEPYSYGPFNKLLYQHLDALEGAGLIQVERAVSGQICYAATIRGRERARQIWNELADDARRSIHGIKQLVTSRAFTSLLQYVYERYPKYAIRSVARR